MHKRMRHLETEGENFVNICISTNCYSFYLIFKTAKRKVIQLLKEMKMKRKRTFRKKGPRNCLEMFDKRSETNFPTSSHYCKFCDRKKIDNTDVDKTSAFYYLYSHLSGSLKENKSFWLGWKFSKLFDT